MHGQVEVKTMRGARLYAMRGLMGLSFIILAGALGQGTANASPLAVAASVSR